MKILAVILVCGLIGAVGICALYEYQVAKQRHVIATRELDVANAQQQLNIAKLRLENALLDEEIAERQHRHPDHFAVVKDKLLLQAAWDNLDFAKVAASEPLPSNW